MFSPWSTPFTDDVSVIPAAVLNKWRLELPQAIDGTGGGSYSPTSVIIIDGAQGIQVAAPYNYKLGSRQVTRQQGMIWADKNAGAAWRRQVSATKFSGSLESLTLSAADWLSIMLDRLPEGQALDEVHVFYEPNHAAAAYSDPPVLTNLPTASLFKVTADGTETQIGSSASADGSSKAAYELVHDITINAGAGIPHTIDLVNNRYFVKITPEAGGEATAGALVRQVTAVVTCTELQEF